MKKKKKKKKERKNKKKNDEEASVNRPLHIWVDVVFSPSFLYYYDSNKKRYKGRTIVFASVSVPIGLIQTWSTYISN
jgi:hypothetical protein